LFNDPWSITTVKFGCKSFWINPARNFSNLLGKILKFMLEIRKGSKALQIIKFAKEA
jgi:hypothetical protein